MRDPDIGIDLFSIWSHKEIINQLVARVISKHGDSPMKHAREYGIAELDGFIELIELGKNVLKGE